MSLNVSNKPAKRMPDDVFVFDTPIKVKIDASKGSDVAPYNGKETYAEGYRYCCGRYCVYLNPWPLPDDDRAKALTASGLTEIKRN